MSLTMGELFAGIGGFSVGFHRAGFETRWAVEWDRDCQRVLAERFPGVPIHGDITTVDPAALAPVDVITFGFPCQDLSVAGKRAGLEGGRSGLFWEAMRVINALRPTVIVAENVPGLLSSNGGRDMASVLWGFLDAGYSDVGWAILDAQWWGVAQRRRRVFIVGCTGNRRASEILAFADGLSGHPAPRRETGAGVAQSIRASTGSRGTEDPDRLTYVPVRAHALACHAAKGGDPTTDNYIAHTLTANGADASEDGTGRGTPLVAFSSKDYGNDAGDVAVAGALSSQPGMKQQSCIATTAVRRLTPRECERLQGFPDVRKTVTIRPCLNCSDHPKTSAIVDSQSHRSLRRASHVAVTVLTEHVPFAERHTAPKHPSDNRPVALSVRIDCERNEVELHSHGRLLWSASGADSQSSYRLPMPVKDFVRLAVRTISTAEQTIQDGRAASPSGNGHSTLLPSGALCVPLCGRENDEPVSDAVVSTTAQGHRSTSITLPATTSSPTSDSTLATLLCSAASAISSCIPDETQDENSSGFSITTTNSWTAVVGMSDSPRYRMLGNAVAVPVVEWIGRRIAEVLR